MKRREMLGELEVFRTSEGVLMEHQKWNPSNLSEADRKKIAAAFRETADAMDRGEFLNNGRWVKYT